MYYNIVCAPNFSFFVVNNLKFSFPFLKILRRFFDQEVESFIDYYKCIELFEMGILLKNQGSLTPFSISKRQEKHQIEPKFTRRRYIFSPQKMVWSPLLNTLLHWLWIPFAANKFVLFNRPTMAGSQDGFEGSSSKSKKQQQ